MKNRIKEVEKMNSFSNLWGKIKYTRREEGEKIIAENFRNYLETTCRFKLLNNPQIGKTKKSPTRPSDLTL